MKDDSNKGTGSQTQQPRPNLDRVDLSTYFFRDGRMGKRKTGQEIVSTENWVAEIFSPPYLAIDGDRRPEIKEITWDHSETENSDYEYRATVKDKGKDKTFYLLHSDQTYHVTLDQLPERLNNDNKGSLVLIKLPSVTHGWDSGQHLIDLEFSVETSIGSNESDEIVFTAPNSMTENIPPAFYMMFYVDSKGKPSVAQMVRFDNTVNTVDQI